MIECICNSYRLGAMENEELLSVEEGFGVEEVERQTAGRKDVSVQCYDHGHGRFDASYLERKGRPHLTEV